MTGLMCPGKTSRASVKVGAGEGQNGPAVESAGIRPLDREQQGQLLESPGQSLEGMGRGFSMERQGIGNGALKTPCQMGQRCSSCKCKALDSIPSLKEIKEMCVGSFCVIPKLAESDALKYITAMATVHDIGPQPVS